MFPTIFFCQAQNDQTKNAHIVRSLVVTAASNNMRAFWDMASSGLTEVHHSFRGAYCLHHQDNVRHCAGQGSTLTFRVFWDVLPCSQIDVDPTFQKCVLPPSSGRSLWWWRQYEPLKRRSTSTWLHGSTYQKTLNFILAAVRTWNLKRFHLVRQVPLSPPDSDVLITHHPDDAGSTHLWNVGVLQWDYTALHTISFLSS
jgi:hypothetical protein